MGGDLLDPRTLPLPCIICGVSITIGARPCEHCLELTPTFNRIMGNREPLRAAQTAQGETA